MYKTHVFQSYVIVFTKQLQVLSKSVCFVTITPLKFIQVTCKQCTARSALVSKFSLGLHPQSLNRLSVDLSVCVGYSFGFFLVILLFISWCTGTSKFVSS